MLYTGKGDGGTTTLFGSKERIPKTAPLPEALGAADELNSLLGLCYAEPEASVTKLDDAPLTALVRGIQENLFIVQAELSGAQKNISEEKLHEAEAVINRIESLLPPIKGFTIAGETHLSALFDYARAVSRRVERRVLAASADRELTPSTRAYLNRLSSILFALARYSAFQSGKQEQNPRY
jgi:cob(I)alamin adenosyltransferase